MNFFGRRRNFPYRKLSAVFAFFMSLAASVAEAQPYFCTRKGTVCEYKRTIVASGKTKWLQTLRIENVTWSEDGSGVVDYSSAFSGRNHLSEEPIRLQARIDTGGNVCIRLSEAMAAVFHNMMPGADISVEGGVTVLPSAMRPGDTLEDAVSTVRAGIIKYTVTVSGRKVLRHEKLKTPAGEFDCMVIREHKEERAPGYSRITNAYTWYSPGVGMVRHDTYNRNMKIETSEVLQKFQLCTE